MSTATSTTMDRALHVARRCGGLKRLQGGYWVALDTPESGARPVNSFGTLTVQALVRRGLLYYSAHKPRNYDSTFFPIEAKPTTKETDHA